MMRTQLDRIMSLSTLPNVRVGVIRFPAELTDIPRHGFDIYDERLVTVSLETSTMTFTERRQVDRYIELFSGLIKDAVWAQDARDYIARIAESLSPGSPGELDHQSLAHPERCLTIMICSRQVNSLRVIMICEYSRTEVAQHPRARLWVPKTCATWPDAPLTAGCSAAASLPGRGMIFGLWA